RNSCDFCYKTSFWGEHFYEHRPLEMLKRELVSMTGGFVFILDDNFLSCRQKARRIFPLLRHSGMVWQAAGSLDIARDPEYLKEAYEAGCRSVFVGFESLSRANMEAQAKNVNAFSDYAQAVQRFHDAGLMINGSFVFGFDGDGPDVFDRTLDFAIENDIETGTFHILTPYPGTATFARMQNAGRLLTTDWELYDTRHAVFRPAGMSPWELESGYHRAYREFYRYGSILKRSLGQPGALKRLAYNVGWKKSDWLWKHIIRLGLMSRIRPIFERILARPTHSQTSADEIQDQKLPASSGQFADEAAIISSG
ncbi:MAG: DUF4070 domain-containing protein, partial [Planctomycetes bacterium]|nr:DUF4070 domain-containing protein [Planctomycetota bacterium]